MLFVSNPKGVLDLTRLFSGRVVETGADDPRISARLTSPTEVVQSNNDQTKADSSTQGLIQQQVKTIVTTTQALMQSLLDAVFGPVDPDDLAVQLNDGDTAVHTLRIFQFASLGPWLDNIPSQGDLAKQMESKLKHWIVSRVMKSLQYDVLIDRTVLEGDLNVQSEDCVQGRKGFLMSSGACATLVVQGIGPNGKPQNQNPPLIGPNTLPTDTSILAQVDFNIAIANAQACGGGFLDFSGFLEPGNTAALPNCFYDFGVLDITGS